MAYIGALPLQIIKGGTGQSTLPTDGQLLIGNTGAFDVANLTSGSGISITNAPGSITIASTTVPPVLTPVFIARKTATASDVTGDGTNYTIIFDTADSNVGAAYDTATGVFTAPDTDDYTFMFCVETADIGLAHTLMDIKIVTGAGKEAHGFYGNPYVSAVSGRLQISQSVAMVIAAADTVHVSFTVSNGTKTVDVVGAATYETWFAGYRLEGLGGGGGGGGTMDGIVDGSGNTVNSSGGYVTFVDGNNVSSLSGSAAHITFNVTGTTDHLVQVGNASGSLTSISAGAAGTVLVSAGAGADPVFTSIPLVTTWTDVTSSPQALAVQNGYVTDLGGGVTYTLPASAVIGEKIQIVTKLGMTTITQNAGQQIRVTSATTTAGVAGTCVSTAVGDCLVLVCSTAGASTLWIAESSTGNWTLS